MTPAVVTVVITERGTMGKYSDRLWKKPPVYPIIGAATPVVGNGYTGSKQKVKLDKPQGGRHIGVEGKHKKNG